MLLAICCTNIPMNTKQKTLATRTRTHAWLTCSNPVTMTKSHDDVFAAFLSGFGDFAKPVGVCVYGRPIMLQQGRQIGRSLLPMFSCADS